MTRRANDLNVREIVRRAAFLERDPVVGFQPLGHATALTGVSGGGESELAHVAPASCSVDAAVRFADETLTRARALR